MGRLGLSENPKGGKANIYQTSMENYGFWPLRAFLEDVLEAYLGPLRASWAILKPAWAVLGSLEASWMHLGTILAVLVASWRHLGGHLGRLGPGKALTRRFLGLTQRFWGIDRRILRALPGPWRAGPETQGKIFWKRTKTKTVRIQHARHPCDKSTGGGGSHGLRPIPPPCLRCGSAASRMFVGISWEASRSASWRQL